MNMRVTKTQVLNGTRDQELWPSNDAYVRAAGAEMIGVCGMAQYTHEPGQVGCREEWFKSGRPVLVNVRRSRDNGLTWTFDRQPFWALTPEVEDRPYGYVFRSVVGHVLDERQDALIRFILSYYVFGPQYYEAGSPANFQNRLFYAVSRDAGRTWTAPRQVVCEGLRDQQGGKYFWLQWAPGVVWGRNNGGFDQPSTLWLPDGTLLVGFAKRALESAADHQHAAALRAQWKEGAADTLVFTIDSYMDLADEVSSNGVCEAAFARLVNGHVLATTRTSGNQRTGSYARIYAFTSADGGRTWSAPFEITFDDGSSLDVPTSMSKILRCSKNGRIYWFGNMLDAPAWGYAPRNKFVAIEIAQNPVRFVKDSVTVVDQSPLGKGQMRYSNFVLYEDRFSRNPIVLMGEHMANEAWSDPGFISNGYRYELDVQGA
jgi:hypothetical protein